MINLPALNSCLSFSSSKFSLAEVTRASARGAALLPRTGDDTWDGQWLIPVILLFAESSPGRWRERPEARLRARLRLRWRVMPLSTSCWGILSSWSLTWFLICLMPCTKDIQLLWGPKTFNYSLSSPDGLSTPLPASSRQKRFQLLSFDDSLTQILLHQPTNHIAVRSHVDCCKNLSETHKLNQVFLRQN